MSEMRVRMGICFKSGERSKGERMDGGQSVMRDKKGWKVMIVSTPSSSSSSSLSSVIIETFV